MSASYYVWYKVTDADDRELERAVRGMQARLACRTGIHGRLLKKRDAPDTWMEVYEGVAEPQGFERQMQDLVEQFDLEMFLRDSRHTECFLGDAAIAQVSCREGD